MKHGRTVGLLAIAVCGLAVGGFGALVQPIDGDLLALWVAFLAVSIVCLGILGWQRVAASDDESEEVAPPPVPEPLVEEVLDERAEGACEFCRRASDSLSVEHITPQERGGTNVRTNLIGLCPPCVEKVDGGVYDPSELRDKVRRLENPEQTML